MAAKKKAAAKKAPAKKTTAAGRSPDDKPKVPQPSKTHGFRKR